MSNFKESGRLLIKEGKRSFWIGTCLTVQEYNQFISMQTELGISNSELIRRRLLENAGNIVINSRELIRHLDSVGAEMARSGNDINRLAKHIASMESQGALAAPVATQFNQLLDDYIKTSQALEVSLRKIILAMAK